MLSQPTLHRDAAAGASATPPLSLLARLALLLGFAVLVCLRLPNVVLHGRFWAEEGAVFYARAATLPVLQALFAPFGGYLNLVANAAPILARSLVPLEYAPWITSGVGLLFQCCPAILLLWSRDPWLRSPVVRIACLLLVATPPVTEEVWLQTLHSQFHLALCCALVLALEVPAGALRWFGFFLLFLAPLCGPSAAALAPLFLARAALDRSRPRLVQGVILGAGAALQFGLFYGQHAGRHYGISPAAFLGFVYIKQIVVPVLGRNLAEPVSTHLKAHLASGLLPVRAMAVSVTVMLGLTGLVLWRRSAASLWLVLSAGLLLLLAALGSLSDAQGLLTVAEAGRYSFVPQVLTGLALAAIAGWEGHRWTRGLAWAAVAWLIAVGLHDVQRRNLFMGNGPDWREEVARWRDDPRHPIAIWPPGWTMSLVHE